MLFQLFGIARPNNRILEIDLIKGLEAVKMMRHRDICFF